MTHAQKVERRDQPIGSHAAECPRRLGWWPGEAQPACTCGLLTTQEQGGKDGQRR